MAGVIMFMACLLPLEKPEKGSMPGTSCGLPSNGSIEAYIREDACRVLVRMQKDD